jgi:hypothetical protein
MPASPAKLAIPVGPAPQPPQAGLALKPGHPVRLTADCH